METANYKWIALLIRSAALRKEVQLKAPALSQSVSSYAVASYAVASYAVASYAVASYAVASYEVAKSCDRAVSERLHIQQNLQPSERVFLLLDCALLLPISPFNRGFRAALREAWTQSLLGSRFAECSAELSAAELCPCDPLEGAAQPHEMSSRADVLVSRLNSSIDTRTQQQKLEVGELLRSGAMNAHLPLDYNLFATMKRIAEDQPVAMRGTQTHRKATVVLDALACSLLDMSLESRHDIFAYRSEISSSRSKSETQPLLILDEKVRQAIALAIQNRDLSL